MTKSPRLWLFITILIAFVMTTPIWVLVSFVFESGGNNWQHLMDTLLPDYILNSILLMIGVASGTLLLGVPAAWLISHYRFVGSRWLHWALLLPLAMPAYISSYTYTGLLEFEGPVQSALREIFGNGVSLWFPEIRSVGGAILLFSFVLYPYVYLLSRSAFGGASQHALEVSCTLGAGPYKSFLRIALPMARPAIIAGVTLALMETLADFGAVQHFGVDTFTTGIYRTWSGLGDTSTAVQLSLVLLAFVGVLILVERWSRKQQRYFGGYAKGDAVERVVLSGRRGMAAFAVCFLPILFGFLVPSGQLLYWTVTTAETGWNNEFFELAWNSFSLAFITAVVAVILAVILAYAKRISANKTVSQTVQLAHLGYAVPGTVLAIAILIPLAWLDKTIDDFFYENYQISTGLLLSGTLFALVFAYSVRFLSVSLQSVESGLQRIKPSMDDSARTLGASSWNILGRIHLPLMKTSLLTALILVFVEVLKELPTTLILRPFNFDTLSIRAYEMAADERLADAGLPALLIVLTGLIPVIILSKLMDKSHA
ncbi:ABC transporter permease [Thiomicrorhabdus xiamenensis]|uniref:Iron ABC transporter permease n=1 Tax=Thiomicrorhabdus xiamenensis TaxID=2739063 RepID=A0A7D4SP47_9GAMM|nr:iron ABC transporter permease [Thiomicrorhabdus xiamenensis]QKI90161.1 iron ABC transporter permease [Thiomicrorhabdus xiamenensis]